MKVLLSLNCLLLCMATVGALVNQFRLERQQGFLAFRGTVDGTGGFRHAMCFSAMKKETSNKEVTNNDVKKDEIKKKETTKKTASTIETFKKTDFVATIAERTGVPKKEAEESLQIVLDIIQEQVAQGKKIMLPGFGSFTLRARSERKGRNPQTGEDLVIPASKNPSFTASKTWKDSINGK